MGIVAVLSCCSTLFWAAITIGFITYIVAILYLQAAESWVDRHDANAIRKLDPHFGTMLKAMYSLLLAVSNGVDWEVLADELSVIGGADLAGIMKLSFALYVVFTMFGIMNVVIGVFVHKTAEMKHHDRDLAVQEEMELTIVFARELKALFDGHGMTTDTKISWDMFKEHLERIEVQMYFQTHHIDISEAEELFALLDSDNSGEICLDDFAYGCQRIKGPAKSIDIVFLFEEVNYLKDCVCEFRDQHRSASRDAAMWQEKVLHSIMDVRVDLQEHQEKVMRRVSTLNKYS